MHQEFQQLHNEQQKDAGAEDDLLPPRKFRFQFSHSHTYPIDCWGSRGSALRVFWLCRAFVGNGRLAFRFGFGLTHVTRGLAVDDELGSVRDPALTTPRTMRGGFDPWRFYYFRSSEAALMMAMHERRGYHGLYDDR